VRKELELRQPGASGPAGPPAGPERASVPDTPFAP
jgi:hypothetical protein